MQEEILHCLFEISKQLRNFSEPYEIRTRDRIQEQCNKIWVIVTKVNFLENCNGRS